jgi:hypothetical protein
MNASCRRTGGISSAGGRDPVVVLAQLDDMRAERIAVDLCAHRRPADYRGRADSRGCRARAGVVLVRRSVRSSPARTDDESVRRASRRRPRHMRSGERFCATRRPCLRPQCSRQWLRQPLVLVSELRVRPGRTGRRTAAAARCSGQTAVDANGNAAPGRRSSRSSVTFRRGGRRPDTCSTARSRIS